MSAVRRHDHVLVHCPRCNERATIDRRSGVLRITCLSCGFINEERGSRSEETRLSRQWALHVYNSGDTLFNAPLWLETNCCGGHRLWALNAHHLEYLAAFVRSKDRTREFPSLLGSRQLADKLPVWMVEAKHRNEVLRALDRLRATL
jgi:hypothetical protein